MPEPLKPYTQIGLVRLLKFWQKKLRLNDWQVTIRFARQSEFEDGEGQGQCSANLHARTAAILILDPADYDPTDYPGAPAQDIEDTVVHELVHLHLEPWNTKNKAELVQMEQAIESMTHALLSLKRRTRT